MDARPDRHSRLARRYLVPMLLAVIGAWLWPAPMPGLPLLVDLGTLGPSQGYPGSSDEQQWARASGASPRGSHSHASAINDLGQVVGWYQGPGGHDRAFLWEKGKMRDLGTLGGRRSQARAINNRGQVVAGAAISPKTNDCLHPFLWENGHMRDLGVLPELEAGAAYAINERGQVVGDCSRVRGRWMWVDAFLWEQGRMRELNGTARGGKKLDLVAAADINDRGEITGAASVPDPGPEGWRGSACLLQGGNIRVLGDDAAGKVGSCGRALTNTGTVLIVADTTGAHPNLVWHRGRATPVSPASGHRDAETLGMNDQGAIVGSCLAPGYGGFRHAILYQNGAWTDLEQVRRAGPRLRLVEARAINNQGQIVGDAITPTGETHAFLLSGVRQRSARVH